MGRPGNITWVLRGAKRNWLAVCGLIFLLGGVVGAAGGCARKKVDPLIAERVWELTSDDPVVVQAAIDFLLAQHRRLVVPALMENLDDLHPLAVQTVLIQDMADAAKPRRRYYPKKFCDLVAALLHHVTGRHLGYIYDGAPDAQRVETIGQWQQWWSENREHY